MAPSLGELDVDQPALPPGSRSIEPAIYVDAVAKTAIPITHYRILDKQQPAVTYRLVAKEWRRRQHLDERDVAVAIAGETPTPPRKRSSARTTASV